MGIKSILSNPRNCRIGKLLRLFAKVVNKPNRILNRYHSFIKWHLAVLFITVGLYVVSKIAIVDQFVIPTSSMEPTLHVGDRILVDKTVMGGRVYTNFLFKKGGQLLECFRLKGRKAIKHNDIVVFNYTHPGDGISFEINNVWCKRVLALPGDTLYVEDGVYRNNNYEGRLGLLAEQVRLRETPDSVLQYLGGFITTWLMPKQWTMKNMGPYYIPRSGDVISINPNDVTLYHDIVLLETGKELTWNWGKNVAMIGEVECSQYVFKGNYYFMGGDNVMDSYDSRYFGLVPEEYIVGVVKCVSYSRDPKTHMIRWNRILKHI